MNKPAISISITVYNLEKYVGACITSILNQHFTDFELIIIDDGSTDTSGKICKTYENADNRVKYIYQENRGVSAARNRAIEASSGKYLLLADGDDQLTPGMLQKLFNLIEENEADMSTCLNQMVGAPSEFKQINNSNRKTHHLDNEQALIRLYSDKFSGFGLCNKLYRRELFNNIKLPLKRSFEDAAIQYKLIHRAKKIVFTEERLYFYVIHGESITRKELTKYNLKRLDIIKNFKECMEYFKQNQVSDTVINTITADYYKSLRWLVIDMMKEDKATQKHGLKIVTEQIILWKRTFLANPCLSKKEIYFIHLWSRLPGLTMFMYQFRNRLVIPG